VDDAVALTFGHDRAAGESDAVFARDYNNAVDVIIVAASGLALGIPASHGLAYGK
jgi:hypothetical protein